MRETIILNTGETLNGLTIGNEEFTTLILVKGDNVVINDIFVYSPLKDFDYIIKVEGKNCIIKNCRFQDIAVNGVCIYVVHDGINSSCCLIESCLFMNRLLNDKNDNNEAIVIGESLTSLMNHGHNLIIGNRLEGYDGCINGISIKCGSNIIANNEIVNSAATICLRHGKFNTVAYNFFDGKNKPNSGGIRIIDTHHIIKGNVIINSRGDGLKSAISLMCGSGIYKYKLDEYGYIKKTTITDNIITNCNNALALGMSLKKVKNMPKLVYLDNNIIQDCVNIYSKHKDNLGAKTVVGKNIIDKKADYSSQVKILKSRKYLDLFTEIMDIKSKTFDEIQNEEKEEKKENVTDEHQNEKKIYSDVTLPAGFSDKVINELANKISRLIMNRMFIAHKMTTIKKIQNNMKENVQQFNNLIAELKSYTK